MLPIFFLLVACTPTEQASSGVQPDYIRLSLGCEDFADLKADLEQSLAKA